MASQSPVLMVVDDERAVLDVVAAIGEESGFDVIACGGGREALDLLGRRHVDLALIDVRMPDIDGLEVLRRLKATRVECEVILMTAFAAVDAAVEAVKLGARDYLTKPFQFDRFRALLADFRAELDGRQRLLRLERDVASAVEFRDMIGRGEAMQQLFSLIRRLAPHVRMALIAGETGTGKELVARALHATGPAASGPFVAVNCSAVVETLFESQLFGHVRGAFTGAVDSRPGLFESAERGTVFLDEIGELPPALQAKLLRVLETGEIVRVGTTQPRRVNARVIAATNRNLREEVSVGRFRSDLFYRLSIVELTVPPLRERREDIPYLVAKFVREFSARFSKTLVGTTPAAERLLVNGAWLGNVRELRNAVERACMLAETDFLTEKDVRFCIAAPPGAPQDPADTAISLPAAEDGSGNGRRLADIEREHIRRVLQENGGNRQHTARSLGLSRRTLYRRLHQFGLR